MGIDSSAVEYLRGLPACLLAEGFEKVADECFGSGGTRRDVYRKHVAYIPGVLTCSGTNYYLDAYFDYVDGDPVSALMRRWEQSVRE